LAKLHSIIEQLKDAGFKVTPQRRAIIDTLHNHDPKTAHEVFTNLKEDYPDISLDTVYRNLHLLVELGVVTQINLQSRDSARFVISADGHYHYLICIQCGSTVKVDFCPATTRITEDFKFQPIKHVFEVYGYCSQCQNNEVY